MLDPTPREPHLDAWTQDFFRKLRPGQMLEPLFESIPGVYYFYKDAQCRFMGGSEGFAHSLGDTSIEQMIGKTDYDYSPDSLADGFRAGDEWVLKTGEAIYNQIELVPASDGSLDWFCTSKMPLFDEVGKVVGLAGVVRVIRETEAIFADHPEMRAIVDFVRAHYREKITVADMAKVGGMSISSQERLFRKSFGLTPLMYVRKTRLNAACRLLRDTDTGLAEIARDCGFNDQTNMTRSFRLELKITPLRYRRRFSDASRRGPKRAV